MSSSCDLCIRYILEYTHNPRLIPVIANGMSSKATSTRRWVTLLKRLVTYHITCNFCKELKAHWIIVYISNSSIKVLVEMHNQLFPIFPHTATAQNILILLFIHGNHFYWKSESTLIFFLYGFAHCTPQTTVIDTRHNQGWYIRCQPYCKTLHEKSLLGSVRVLPFHC